ncbi:LysR family transcriptional regulator [Bythopirellula goksoeyrii]|uniref:Transcriptional activator protein NhaR n=1 Tax=Bythopirellula goksoeyrii TaxID=1400387 RepID=A0A5B9QQT5_9BACT|nr:LysR family transcriptional regulator [Bythopirellula goksoeyrii]QEG36333.1 Transcriptional activator protein NhaR [Bythopirellula goksoeyrii]
MDWLNYNQLLNFWAVAREGSVQRASEVLHVTPASVSVQVKQLEQSLGVKLLKKQGRGIALTKMGEHVSTYANEIFATGRELVEMVKGQPVGRPLELRVGVRDVMPKLMAFQLLLPALESEYPVKLVCQEGDMSHLVADLAVHKLDLILTDTALDPLYKVQAYSHRLSESDVVIIGSKALARKYRKGFPASLDGAPFLLPTANCVLRRLMDQWFRDLDLAPAVKGEFADSAMLKIAGRHGVGLFAIPTSILEEVKAIYGLREVGIAAGIKEQSYAVTVEKKLKHPAVVEILEHARSI